LLPPARYYRKEFRAAKRIERAVVYASALGLYELCLNGQRVSDAFFLPGWSDYRRRVYYNTFDVTPLVRAGENCIGAVVADGWYAGYLGYGLLVGYGPNQVGRYFYGKTPAWLAQLEIEYSDGSRLVVSTDPSWKVTGQGPIREADLLMGETWDARRDMPDWCRPGFDARTWETAIRAEANGSTRAVYSDTLGDREVELGFQKPLRLQAYPGPPIRITQELPARNITEPAPGVFIFDLGQNFAGIIRLKVKGPAGTKVQIRHGEMLHPDGRLMTENLRRARATDYYILRGDPQGETWSPRFTYHGFQYVELSGLPVRPELDAVTGLVLHSDTPLTGTFACSDPVLTRFWRNTQWTQRANFIELPTDCPQRDERFGWMGDAQVYVRAASYNADVSAFFTKWLDDVEEAQREFGAYPDYCPYPMAHGSPRKTFGTAWTDAGIICPWTVWMVYGDTRIIERHWESMRRFMDFRAATTTPDGLGVSIGNPWGDWLNQGETTPVEFIDTCYNAYDCRLMAEMAQAVGRHREAENYRKRSSDIKAAFAQAYLQPEGTLRVDTQTAYVLALAFQLVPPDRLKPAANRLAAKIAANGYRMATGFLGTKSILPVLSTHGHHDLAVRLFQSRQFPSWAYEVVNGATSVWERWDSFTKEDGFGRHNAAMNSFSHYSFGAVTEWMFRDLAGIDTDGPGFQHLLIRPRPSAANRNPAAPPLDWVQAEYDSIRGKIVSQWRRDGQRLALALQIPANTKATVFLPSDTPGTMTESGVPVAEATGVTFLGIDKGSTVLTVESGRYLFSCELW
jgi:alpha-L-rhamnosidase